MELELELGTGGRLRALRAQHPPGHRGETGPDVAGRKCVLSLALSCPPPVERPAARPAAAQ